MTCARRPHASRGTYLGCSVRCRHVAVHVQATFQGFLSAGLFFFVANAKPRPVLSSARPHQTVFCTYVMSSLLLQFAVQICFIIYMYQRSYHAMDEVRNQSHSTKLIHSKRYLSRLVSVTEVVWSSLTLLLLNSLVILMKSLCAE